MDELKADNAEIEIQHLYLSTACLHGRHSRCRVTCKFCGTICTCGVCQHAEALKWRCGHPTHTLYSLEPLGTIRLGKDGRILNIPAKPERLGWWRQRRREKQCRKAGGHWWHPDKGMIDWFCCQCGAERDGAPEDGR